MILPARYSGPTRPAKAAGFGLVEALVSLVLIAILAVVLLPLMGSMAERARTAKCLTNLRTFHTVLNAYTRDNNGRFPSYRKYITREDGTSANGADWRTTIAPYLPDVPKRTRLRNKTLDVCPSADFESKNSYTFYYALTAESTSADPTALAQVETPAHYFLLGESHGQMRIYRGSGINDFDFRHQGRANLLFLDGHLESRLPDEIPLTKTTREYNSFWLGK
ncbi:MAG TPA: prepilin-type N-terminal cleavage/methylation domain-containing protein [Chthoniobacteraceae bacterium]|nr:prepilin-type N-terminal cleavage/methylation domain-containing protein [Chthoniobacteraceae bacterium]